MSGVMNSGRFLDTPLRRDRTVDVYESDIL